MSWGFHKGDGVIFLNQSDEEQTAILFRIVNKNKKLALDTARNAREKLIYDLIIGIVNARFDALNDKGKMNYDFAGNTCLHKGKTITGTLINPPRRL